MEHKLSGNNFDEEKIRKNPILSLRKTIMVNNDGLTSAKKKEGSTNSFSLFLPFRASCS